MGLARKSLTHTRRNEGTLASRLRPSRSRGGRHQQVTLPCIRVEKRLILFSRPTARVMQSNRLASGGTPAGSIGGLSRNSSTAGSSIARSNTSASAATAGLGKYGSLAAKKGAPPPPPSSHIAAPPPPYSNSNTPAAAAAVSAAAKRAPPPPPVKPKPPVAPKPVVYVTALYDYDAQADGDLSFKAGDKIELVEKSQSAEDWWTGKLRGSQGVFPGKQLPLTRITIHRVVSSYLLVALVVHR